MAECDLLHAKYLLQQGNDILQSLNISLGSHELVSPSKASLIYKKIISKNPHFSFYEVSPGGVIVIGARFPTSEGFLGLDLFANSEESQLSEYALSSKETVVTGPVSLVQGGTGIILRKAVFDGSGSFQGFIGLGFNWSDALHHSPMIDYAMPDMAAHKSREMRNHFQSAAGPVYGDLSPAESSSGRWVQRSEPVIGGVLTIAINPLNVWAVNGLMYGLQFIALSLMVAAAAKLLLDSYQGQKLDTIKYRLLFEQSSDALFLLDDERVMNANTAAVNLLGLNNVSQLIGLTITDFSSVVQVKRGDTTNLPAEKIIEAYAQGRASFEWWMRRVDNGNEWLGKVALRSVLLGKQQRVLARIKDLTQVRAFEEQLKRLATKYQAIFDQSIDADSAGS